MKILWMRFQVLWPVQDSPWPQARSQPPARGLSVGSRDPPFRPLAPSPDEASHSLWEEQQPGSGVLPGGGQLGSLLRG